MAALLMLAACAGPRAVVREGPVTPAGPYGRPAAEQCGAQPELGWCGRGP